MTGRKLTKDTEEGTPRLESFPGLRRASAPGSRSETHRDESMQEHFLHISGYVYDSLCQQLERAHLSGCQQLGGLGSRSGYWADSVSPAAEGTCIAHVCVYKYAHTCIIRTHVYISNRHVLTSRLLPVQARRGCVFLTENTFSALLLVAPGSMGLCSLSSSDSIVRSGLFHLFS